MPTAEHHAMVYNALDSLDASLRIQLLDSHGISVLSVGGQAIVGFGEIAPREALDVQLWVLKEDLPEATRLMTEFDKERNQAPTSDWACSCGETNPKTFEVCWQCGASAPGVKG